MNKTTMRTSFSVGRTLCAVALAVGAVLVQGCSAVKLAYHQVPHLAYWQLNRYLDLSTEQTERVRDELGDLHQWHRQQMLPEHAQLLQKVQQQLPSALSPEQACDTYGEVRTQFDQVLQQSEPKLVWLAAQLSASQIRHLQTKQAKSNADWKKEWLDPAPDELRAQRFKLLLSRTEDFYGPLQAAQKTALQSFIDQSSFEPQRSYAERLRRQQDLVQVLQHIAQDRANTERASALLRGYVARFNASPDVAYQRYAQALVAEGCQGFARVHNTMTAAQRLKAAQSLKGYEQDLWALAGR